MIFKKEPVSQGLLASIWSLTSTVFDFPSNLRHHKRLALLLFPMALTVGIVLCNPLSFSPEHSYHTQKKSLRSLLPSCSTLPLTTASELCVSAFLTYSKPAGHSASLIPPAESHFFECSLLSMPGVSFYVSIIIPQPPCTVILYSLQRETSASTNPSPSPCHCRLKV